MWDLPRPGLEPMSLALAGGFLTTVPPEKSTHLLLNCTVNIIFSIPYSLLFSHSVFIQFTQKAFKSITLPNGAS